MNTQMNTHTPTDTQIQTAVMHLLENSENSDLNVKSMLKLVKSEHQNWSLGKKRLQEMLNQSLGKKENDNQSSAYGNKITKLDTPISSKNIMATSRRPQEQGVFTGLLSSPNSPTKSDGEDSDVSLKLVAVTAQWRWSLLIHCWHLSSFSFSLSFPIPQWEAPAELFERPGSGLKPRSPQESAYEASEDEEQQETHFVQPRSIVFVPSDNEEEEETTEETVAPVEGTADPEFKVPQEQTEEETAKQTTVANLQAFFNREKVHNHSKTVQLEEAQRLKELAIPKLQAFFDRKNDDSLPVLPLARINTVPVVLAPEEDELVKPAFTPEARQEEGEDTTCNACFIM